MKHPTIGEEIMTLANLMRRHTQNRPGIKAADQLTGTNAWVLCYLKQNEGKDIYQKDCEEKFGITRSATSKVVNLMEKNGWIRRESVQGDARLKKLVLTDQAKELLDMMEKELQLANESLLAGFSEEEIATLDGYLSRMQENMKQQ